LKPFEIILIFIYKYDKNQKSNIFHHFQRIYPTHCAVSRNPWKLATVFTFFSFSFAGKIL